MFFKILKYLAFIGFLLLILMQIVKTGWLFNLNFMNFAVGSLLALALIKLHDKVRARK